MKGLTSTFKSKIQSKITGVLRVNKLTKSEETDGLRRQLFEAVNDAVMKHFEDYDKYIFSLEKKIEELEFPFKLLKKIMRNL